MDNKEDSLLLPLPSWTVTVRLLCEQRDHLILLQSSQKKYWCLTHYLSKWTGTSFQEWQLPMAEVKPFMACPFVKPRLMYVVALSACQLFLMLF